MAAGTLAAVAAMHDGVRECMLLERTLAAEEGENSSGGHLLREDTFV